MGGDMTLQRIEDAIETIKQDIARCQTNLRFFSGQTLCLDVVRKKLLDDVITCEFMTHPGIPTNVTEDTTNLLKLGQHLTLLVRRRVLQSETTNLFLLFLLL